MPIVQPPSSIITRQRVAHEVVWMPVVWAILAVAVVLLTAGFATLTTISESAWVSATWLSRWYIAALGVNLVYLHLPLYLTHGFSRREFMGQIPVYMAIAVAIWSLLTTLGFGLEAVAFGGLGWEQALGEGHLYGSATEYHLILAESCLSFLAWMAVGALVGATLYRFGGAPTIPVFLLGLFALTAGEASMRLGILGPIPVAVPGLAERPLLHAVTVFGALTFAALALTSLVIRGVPVRTTDR